MCIFFLGKMTKQPEKNQGERVVLDLVNHLPAGHGITTDNFFTSLQLSDKLWVKGMTLCGTLRKNKAFIPNELLPRPYKPIKSSMFAYRDNRTLVSYVPKKNRAVILLSSQHTDDKVGGEDEDYKPEIILSYNKTKGAVDVGDQLAQQYSTQRKTNRWPMALFYHILDIAAINAFKVWMFANPGWKEDDKDARRKFLLQLGKDLVKENIIRRHNNKYIQRQLKDLIIQVVPEVQSNQPTMNTAATTTKVQDRCYLCCRKRDRKTRQQCTLCKKFVCAEHSSKKLFCQNCNA